MNPLAQELNEAIRKENPHVPEPPQRGGVSGARKRSRIPRATPPNAKDDQ